MPTMYTPAIQEMSNINPAPPPPIDITAIQLNNMQHALNFILFWGKCAEEPRASFV